MKREDTKKNTKAFFKLEDNNRIIKDILNEYKEQLKLDYVKLKDNNLIIIETKNVIDEIEFLKSLNSFFNESFECSILDYNLKVIYKKEKQIIFLKIKRITF